jgi:hypothetical protein
MKMIVQTMMMIMTSKIMYFRLKSKAITYLSGFNETNDHFQAVQSKLVWNEQMGDSRKWVEVHSYAVYDMPLLKAHLRETGITTAFSFERIFLQSYS